MLVILAFITAASACVYKGEKFNNGETWVARSTFVLRCEISSAGWKTRVIGCKTQNGVFVTPGQTIQEGNTRYECIAAKNGRVEIRRTLEVDHNTRTCGEHALGETWIAQKNFVQFCSDHGVKVVSCLSDAGIPIPLNGSLLLSGLVYNCVQLANGNVTIRREVAPLSNAHPTTLRPVELLGPMFKKINSLSEVLGEAKTTTAPIAEVAQEIEVSPATQVAETGGIVVDVVCNFDGEIHKAGETWVADNVFTKKCTEDGGTVILNCLIDGKTVLNVDSEVTIARKTHKCYRKKSESRVYYESRSN